MDSVEDGLRFLCRAQNRPALKNFWSHVFGNVSSLANKIIEIRGSTRGVELVLMEIMARTTMPLLYSDCTYKDQHVLYMDCTSAPHMPNIFKYFGKVITNKEKSANSELIRDALNEAIRKISMVLLGDEVSKPCYDFTELVLQNSRTALVVIDNIDDFYTPTVHRRSMTYTDKICDLKVALSSMNVTTVFVHNDTTSHITENDNFEVVDIILIVSDYGNGCKILYCDEKNKYEVFFQDETNLHD